MPKERESQLSERVKFLEVFFDTCESISLPYPELNYLIQEINLMSDENLRIWVQIIDEAMYPLSEWLSALVFFQEWLKLNNKGKNFPNQIEYINCCIHGSVSGGRLLTLQDLLKNYLEIYSIV